MNDSIFDLQGVAGTFCQKVRFDEAVISYVQGHHLIMTVAIVEEVRLGLFF